jgi:zinc D-Ala-D-Ala dipeptidase
VSDPPEAMTLQRLTEAEDGLAFDIRYATADNLTGRPIYRRPVAMLVLEARARLARARDLAASLGYRLVVFDAFRPLEAQWALWDAVANKDFVADPRRGGVHPRGVAVDLTLAEAATGRLLPMGTGFDAITPLSAHGSLDVPAEARRNRALLLGIMMSAGWDNYLREWWHYQLFDPRRYPAHWASAVPDGPM